MNGYTFDIVLDYTSDRRSLYQTICKEVSSAYPDYRVEIKLDADLSD